MKIKIKMKDWSYFINVFFSCVNKKNTVSFLKKTLVYSFSFTLLILLFLNTPSDLKACARFFNKDISNNTESSNLELKNVSSSIIQYIKEFDAYPTRKELSSYMNISSKDLKDIIEDRSVWQVLVESNSNYATKIINKILKKYAAISAERGVTCTEIELIEALDSEFERTLVSQHVMYKTFQDLKAESKKMFSSRFDYVLDDEIYNEKNREKLLTALNKRSRFILTTAVSGAEVDKDFLAALLNYCEKKNADIIVYPANMQTSNLDPVLLSSPRIHILTNSVELSPFLKLYNIKIMAKQINPLTGLARIGSRLQTHIIGATKIHVEAVPTIEQFSEQNPRLNLTTGAITVANYNGKKEISRRTDAIAENDHVLGGIILEKVANGSFLDINAGSFNMRHIEYIPAKRGFLDIDTFYTQDTVVSKISPEAVVLGDIHIGDLNQELITPLVKQILSLNPKYVILGDLFNGESINHHDSTQVMTRAKKARSNKLDLSKELSSVVSFLNSLLAVNKDIKVVIQPSNHNEWLMRWLESGNYIQDATNTTIGVALSYAVLIDEKDPLEFALTDENFQSKFSIPFLSDKSRFIYLPEDSSFRVAQGSDVPVEVGLHGHLGAGGRRGSMNAMIKGVDAVVYGHTHSDARKNKHVNIGTFTHRRLDYTHGFSSWVNSLALIGEDGQIQVLYFNDGSWYNESNFKGNGFYKESYPRIIPNRTGSSEGQLDQYSGN